MRSISATRIRHGMAPCRGIAEVFELPVLFLIFGDAMRSSKGTPAHSLPPVANPAYFLNKLSNAARASVGLRGACIVLWSPFFTTAPEGIASRATVTFGENSSHVLA